MLPRAIDVQYQLDRLSVARIAEIAGEFPDPARLQGYTKLEDYRAGLVRSLPKGRRAGRQRLTRLTEILGRTQDALQRNIALYLQLRRQGPAVLSDAELAFSYGLDMERAMRWRLCELETSLKLDMGRARVITEEITRLQHEEEL